jgi:hypothetical protein
MNTQKTHRTTLIPFSWTRIATILLAAILTPAFTVTAQEGDRDERFASAEQRLEKLLHEAHALADEGKEDAAAELRQKAEKLKERIKNARDDRDEGRDKDRAKDKDREHQGAEEGKERIVQGLIQGIKALVELGHEETANHLEEIVREFRDGNREKPEKRESGVLRGREDVGDKSQKKNLEQELEVLRVAFTAFREAEKKDAAEMVEHAIHARELALEGRKDDEAIEIRESAPKAGQVAELLMWASKLWAEFGNEKKAKLVGNWGKEFAGRSKREKKKREKEERPKAESRDKGLEKRIGNIEATLEEVVGAIRKLSKERD